MSDSNLRPLHWTQRIALIRHNLHAASRSDNFNFFKSVQAAGLIEGTNHYATLNAVLDDNADMLCANLDNLNVGLAYIHQDAFKNIYDNLKKSIRENGHSGDLDEEEISKLYVDVTTQRNMADGGIDKTVNSVVALLEQQPIDAQDPAANVWITGVTFIADCMEVVLQQMEALEYKKDEYIRLEESWNLVKASVVASVTGYKGVFSLMDTSRPAEEKPSRSMSISTAGSSVFRRLSTAFQSPATNRPTSTVPNLPPPIPNRGPQVSFGVPVYRTPNAMRNSANNAVPTRLPTTSTKLQPIPPTPHTEDLDPLSVHIPYTLTETPPDDEDDKSPGPSGGPQLSEPVAT